MAIGVPRIIFLHRHPGECHVAPPPWLLLSKKGSPSKRAKARNGACFTSPNSDTLEAFLRNKKVQVLSDSWSSERFRRIEHIGLAPKQPVLIEIRCAFCAFSAASSDEKILQFAASTHDCPGIRRFRQRQRKRS